MTTSAPAGLTRLTATELAAAYAAGTLSPVEATQAALDAVHALDPVVNAFVLVDDEAALAAARRSAARWHAGKPLGSADGVPTAVKDIFLTRGWPTLRGSSLISPDQPWEEDAPCVARLRAAGAVLLGKTTTPELAWKGVTDSPTFGATGNPWDPARTSGGSSGGSATAVGLGMATWAVGTDGGGSVRIPAAFTGTVALKPTFGLVPLHPASPFGALSHAGPMTRTVTDAALMLDVVSGFDARDPTAMPTPARSFTEALDDGVAGLRIAFSPTLGHVRNDPEVEAAVRAAVDVLAAAGAVVEEVDPGFADPVQAFDVLWSTGAAKVVEAFGPDALDAIDPGLRRCVERGTGVSASRFLDAMAVRADLGRRMGLFHLRHDLLVTPTVPIPAFATATDAPPGWPSQDWPPWTPYTYPFNMTQQPAASVPCGFTSGGLPVGLHVVGARHADALVLRAARAYEAATTWHESVPPLATNPPPPSADPRRTE